MINGACYYGFGKRYRYIQFCSSFAWPPASWGGHMNIWRDRMKPWARKFYNSKEWQACREAYIASKQGLCERCLAEGRISPGEIVHHRQWLTRENINDPSVTLNWDNLELLCWSCHNKEHSKELPISEEITFDAEGNVIRSNNPPDQGE